MRFAKNMLFLMALVATVLPVNSAGALDLYGNTNTNVTLNTSVNANVDITAEMIGGTETIINAATSETTEVISGTGTLIEIGNTTAENTTIIIRVQNQQGATEDRTFEINSSTKIVGNSELNVSLSDWIAGDPILFTARHATNSDAWVSIKLKNLAFKSFHQGINGWITAINAASSTVSVFWNNATYTLNVANAKMVAGLKNPATIADLHIGDRVRARVVNDNDGSRLTWNAEILVVLRRGNTLFMRVTRWVVPATITMIPEDLTLPVTIEAEVAASKFYQAGDVNNLIGAPGTKIMVDITQDTKLVRRYYGRALLAEFSEGDSIQIIGRRDETTGHLVARVVKNNSIQRLGVAHRLGEVTAIDASAKTLTVLLIGTDMADKTWTIKASDTTKVYVNGTLGSFADISVGAKVRVRGTANRVQKTVTADVIVVVE